MLIILNTSSAQIFSEEPIIRVRIIYTLDSLSIAFNDAWIMFQENLEELRINKDDSLRITIEDECNSTE